MGKIITKMYWLFLLIFISLFLWITFHFLVDIDSRNQTTCYTVITDYSVETLSDSNAPKGVRLRYTFTPDLSISSFCHLIFYSVHQEIIVSMDGKTIYSLKADSRNSFGHTPGNVWNTIQLSEKDRGKEIQIDLIPVYDSSINYLPTIYYGDRYDIFTALIIHNLPALFLSVTAILAGIVYIGFILYAYKKGTADTNLIMLGTFAILIGMWKLSDMEIFSLLVHNNLVAAYLPFFTLLLACVPYNLFIRSLHSTRKHWAWYIPCIVSYAAMFLELTLQLLHIADFRETLFLTHISILLMVLVIVIMMIIEIRNYGFNKQLKRNIFCICGCIVGLVTDMIIYYATNAQGTLICGMLGFVIYIFVLGIGSMQEMRRLIAIGQEAQKFEEMAFHDKITGLYNRTAYADYTGKDDFSPEHMIVAMFDLNNLKKCNDEFGHDQGDIYITTCAKLISDCFSDIGNCYRMGGDEFCVLIKGTSLETCRNRVSTLYKKVEKENEKKVVAIKMAIACGYVIYDKLLDFDIQDTMRRADKMMYKEKYSMKHPG